MRSNMSPPATPSRSNVHLTASLQSTPGSKSGRWQRLWRTVKTWGSNFVHFSGELWTRWVTDWWALDIGALLLCLSSLGALVAVLKEFDSSEVDFWPSKLTLNTVIVILSVTSRVCLLVPLTNSISQLRWLYYRKQHRLLDFQTLDNASRGVIGSFETFLRIRQPLAVAGALVVILTLGFEAMTQQTLLTITPSYVPVLLDLQRLGTPFDFAYSDTTSAISSGLTNAALAAVLDPTDEFYDPTVQFQASPNGAYFFCGGGPIELCTSPTYATLELCAQCQNVTAQLNNSCTDERSATCERTLPSGLSLSTESQRMVVGPSVNSSNNATRPPNIVADFEVIANLPCEYADYTGSQTNRVQDPNCTFFAAHHCTLSLCAKMYQMVRVGFEPDLVEDQTAWAGQAAETETSQLQVQFSSNTTKPDGYYVFQSTDPNQPQYMKKIDLTSHLLVDQLSSNFLRDYFSSMWTGSVPRTAINASQPPYFQQDIGANFQTTLSLRAFNATLVPTDLANQYELNAVDEMEDYLTSMAYSMSIWLRNFCGTVVFFANAPSASPYYGVQWAWLAFPLVLQAVTAGLLLAVIILTHQQRLSVWKSSTLATLYHGINREARPKKELSNATLVSEMEGIAKSKQFKLAQTPSGRRLVGTDDDDDHQNRADDGYISSEDEVDDGEEEAQAQAQVLRGETVSLPLAVLIGEGGRIAERHETDEQPG